VKKGRIELLLIGVTVLALSAGVVAGLLAARLPGSPAADSTLPPPPPMPPEQSLTDQLQLNAEQREQMRGIWEGVRGNVHKTFEQAESLQQERDRAVVAMLNDEQKARFEKISKDFADRYEKLTQERDQLFNEAVKKTKTILNEQQREKYEQILKTHVPPGPPPGHRAGMKMFVVPAGSPATQPLNSQPVR